MSTRINSNSSVVNVGRTTPVSPGQQPASRSIPVVLASDQQPIPVEEQNKVQSEVSLSLLGIPRAEVALGIFADVNTYDVNPSEWSSQPPIYTPGLGIKHLPNEAGALVEAVRDKNAILTSKRFFRYQPGRVSAATFGVKATVSTADFAPNPAIRKYGIFDNFDGYYWEHRQSGEGDNFNVVRRTQSLLNFPNSPFGNVGQGIRKATNFNDEQFITKQQTDDYRACGKGFKIPKGNLFVRERDILTDKKIAIAESAFEQALANTTWTDTSGNPFNTQYGSQNAVTQYEDRDMFVFRDKCHRDVQFAIEMYMMDLEWGGDAHTRLNSKNYRTALLPNPEREKFLYSFVKDLILAEFSIGSGAYNKLDTLTDITLDLFSQNTASVKTYWQTLCATVDWGNKERIDTIFDARKYYWSYFVSSYSAGDVDAGATIPYSNTAIHSTSNAVNYRYNPINGPGDGLDFMVNQVIPGYVPPLTQLYGTDVSATMALELNRFYENIKYKCARDLLYVIDGYKNDIVGGGNAETKYNMSMYYKGDGQSIYSQSQDGNSQVSERSRHTHLRDMILEDLKEAPFNMNTSNPIESKIISLAGDLIENFNSESTIAVEYGTRGFAANLVAFRDGLPMIHAAVNDPSLLKPIEKIKAHTRFEFIDFNNDGTAGPGPDDYDMNNARLDGYQTVFTLTKGIVTFGQKVRMYTGNGQDWPVVTGTSGESVGGWQNGAIFTVDRVIGAKGNQFTIRAYKYSNNPEGQKVFTIDPDTGEDFTPQTNDDGDNYVYFELVTPFEVPEVYDPQYYRFDTREAGTITNIDGVNISTNYDDDSDPFIKGMQFPLKYSSNIQLDDAEAVYLGYIDTSLDSNVNANLSEIRRQYDNINFNIEYINWIKNNVNPEYWGVYEYRVPRSRFSHDKLDGKVSKRVYSDVATGPTGIVRPGANVQDQDGLWEDAISLYNFDFTKVTMLKVEFSWYGAVGALFLAYVPIDNGEARWVRVHHLRASNQLKIASLGNATLPITYNVWGGGSEITGGDLEYQTDTYNYGNASHHIVKYGASYYIDGGDRGTVRLYSHNNNTTVDAVGKKWQITTTGAAASRQYEITELTTTDGVPIPSNKTFFMGAELQTGDARDQGIKVNWVNGNFVEFTRQPVGQGITLVTDRAPTAYGLETKDVIVSAVNSSGVRNRVQVYPTKLSTANLGNNPVRMRMKKTPVFQTEDVIDGTLNLSAEYTISAEGLPLTVTESAAPDPFLLNNAEKYGWFQARVLGEEVTVFGRLYKLANSYYFDMFDTFTDTVTLKTGEFLPDDRFAYQANTVTGDVNVITYSDETRTILPSQDSLTSINVVNNPVLPIPGTGTSVATLYLTQGTEQIELNTYFDYNKEYLSYPLTDEVESLYIAVDSDTLVGENTDPIAVGITWEEQ